LAFKAHWVALISISLALSQTQVFTLQDHGYRASALFGARCTCLFLWWWLLSLWYSHCSVCYGINVIVDLLVQWAVSL